jgi:hypothetical protein
MIFHGISWYFMVVHSILINSDCVSLGRFGISYDSIGTVESVEFQDFPVAWPGKEYRAGFPEVGFLGSENPEGS